MVEMLYYNRLQFLREETYGENKVKQTELAKFVGIALGTYRNCESENNIFKLEYLNKVCEFYNVSLDYVFSFSNIKNYQSNNYKIDIEKSRKRIKLLRTNLGLTAKELGKILNCTASNINNYEAGKYIITTKKLYKLCKEFSVSADFILGKTDEPKRIETNNKKLNKIPWIDLNKGEFCYSKILKSLRSEKGLIQDNISDILKIERGTYGQYEVGNVIIPINHLDTLSNYFDVSIDYILGLSDIRKYNNSKNINSILSGKRLKELRKIKGYNQEKLAKDLNVPRSTIAGYEAGRYIIPTNLLYNLCIKYNISADYILGKIDKPNNINLKK